MDEGRGRYGPAQPKREGDEAKGITEKFNAGADMQLNKKLY